MRIALAQINTAGNISENIEKVERYVTESVVGGADVVVFPEATMVAFGNDLGAAADTYIKEWRTHLSALAQDNNVWIIAGEFENTDNRVRNIAGVYSPEGMHEGYAKIHLYDAFGFSESETVEPGESPLVVQVGDRKVGFAICYDIRFPKLFAELSRAGAELIVVPTSWGSGPGKVEQWEVLGRARALDSNSYVVALGQADPSVSGVNAVEGAPTGVGHSYVSDPFGKVIAKLGEGEELQIIDLSFDKTEKAKESLPVLKNAKLGY
ncbi:UPF0012-like hydrolase [Corynebacterium deserti GIMN1.010]|uniref:UPF0012-like hydrolase n=1 Tax=Corynebacterium deserti GIMN1.010 TaxID=931089 RepID=A0A0M4CVA6_9CORY|nr:carbon-nitrogen hydrolase family protein [Corynebacterium deserti]ALC04532.1 UPF0012-like hydrolase [Corynebacterium deserti GIMN1.010]